MTYLSLPVNQHRTTAFSPCSAVWSFTGELAGFAKKKNKKKRRATGGNEGEEFKGEGEATPPLHSPSPEEPTLAGFRGAEGMGFLGREVRFG